jgi:succinate-semialdehyde dehydrogenase/glutarate-semialdehyde dehydrogenase
MSIPGLSVPPALLVKLPTLVTLADFPHEQMAVRAPYTGEVIGHIPAGTVDDVEAAVSRARAAQSAWAARSFGERASVFLRFHDLVFERQNEALDLIQLETGKARRHAFEEILDTTIVSRYYALHAERFLGGRRRRGALPLLTRTWEFRVPLGVVAFMVPWNYPLNLAITDAIPALMAGNTGVLKPDPQTSLTALWAVSLLREAGLPADVFPVVTGEGPLLGPALADRVDYVMFTGSTRVGRIVGRQAAERLIGCSLELGGKNAMLVLGDADVEAAVDSAVRGCFVGAGQVCISIERIYVQESIFESFLRSFAVRTKALRIGAAADYAVEMGSLTSERQLATVREHVRDAVEKGAQVVAGGNARPEIGPLFFEPTVLTGVREGMLLFASETFGPVVSVYPFGDEAEAIERINSTRYGLSASIWTGNPRRAVGLARRIQAGSVNINEAYAAAWGSVDSPIGGMKESGLHPRHGAEGILKFTQSQTVAAQRWLPIGPPRGVDPAVHARWMTRLLKIVKRTRVLG